jgi:hypothetical protein
VTDRALKLLPAHRYDAIVVNEGQDLDSLRWLPLLDLLRDRQWGIVYVFGAVNRDLCHAPEPHELGVVMPNRCRSPTSTRTVDALGRCTNLPSAIR